MTRKVLFQLHWLLGITAGLVLAVMGVTGALMSFQSEILAICNPAVVKVAAIHAPRLSPAALIAAASAQHQGDAVAALMVDTAPDRAGLVEFVSRDPRQRHGDRNGINPYTGQLLGQLAGAEFFLAVRNLHRYLLLPGAAGGIGRPITGVSTLALIFFAVSGLYLRWPRQPLDWRNWFTLDLRRRGRDLYRQLHAVIGSWLLLLYLLSALTGLWWSFEVYRGAVTRLLASAPAADAARHEGQRRPRRSGPPARFQMEPAALDRAWRQFQQDAGAGLAQATLLLPRDAASPLLIRSLSRDARYARMNDDWSYAAADGRALGVKRYQALPAGDLIIGHILPLHDGSFFGLPGRLALFLSSLSMPLFTITGWLLYLGRRRRQQQLRAIALPPPVTDGVAAGPLIIYASQAGHAERLARLTAQACIEQGWIPQLLELNRWQPQACREGQLCLLIVSTYGEGEPPDQGRLFVHRQLRGTASMPLPALEFSVLALGDRMYPDFCAFGRQLDGWLEQAGGRRRFPLLTLDGEDPHGLQQWQRQLRQLGFGGLDAASWGETPWQAWRLLERRCLNPASPQPQVFLLRLVAEEGHPADWLPGDLVEIQPTDAAVRLQALASAPCMDRPLVPAGDASPAVETSSETVTGLAQRPELKPREYSIASIAAQGEIQLLVRQTILADGRMGLCSGWLTHGLAIGEPVPLRIRCNPSFHPPAAEVPLILIGSGTGLAGLLAHLRARTAGSANWLLFGERRAATDDYFSAELAQAVSAGRLQRLDRVYSRDGHGPRYVQDQLAIAAEDVRAWVQRGAAIYICGSLQGMATDVDTCLREILGAARLDAMRLAGRYRRDVY